MDRAFSYGSGRWRVALVAIVALAPTTVAHATKFWKNGVTSGNWSTGSNWSGVSAAGVDNGGVPVASEPVRIVHTDGVARTVTLDTNPPSLGLTAIDLTGSGSTTDTLLIPNNNSLTVGAIAIGGYNGAAETNGRGALTQSNGALTISSGLDMVVAWGAGSTGVYTLSGGSVQASQSELIGNKGTGTFNQSAGMNTILANGVGAFFVGQLAGSNGAYNLSGTGQLISNESEYIGNLGSGTFTQTGGTNTINGAKDLILGNGAGGSGIYTISAGTLTANNNVNVGVSGAGTLNIQGNSFVNVTNAVNINGSSAVNLSGGTLRLNSSNAPNRINFTSGRLQLIGDRTIGTDPIVSALFGATPVIPSGKELLIEGYAFIRTPFNVNGGKLLFTLNNRGPIVGASGSPSTLSVTNGGTISINGEDMQVEYGSTLNVDGLGSTINCYSFFVAGGAANGYAIISNGDSVIGPSGAARIGSINNTGQGFVTVTGMGSSLILDEGMQIGSTAGASTLTIQDNGLVSALGALGTQVNDHGILYLNGGTLHTTNITFLGTGQLFYNSGTIALTGNRSIGSDPLITTYYGVAPVLQTGKGLGIDGTATLLTPVTIDGGTFSAGLLASGANLTMNRGKFNLTNQILTIGAGGTLGSTLDLNDDMVVNVALGTTNQGLVTGDGELGGTFTNASTGELRGEPGKSLKLTGANNINAGQVNLFGGMVEFTQNLTNSSGGFISGNGTLKVGTLLTNSGTMNFSGLANIVGDVTNNAGAKIISSGGGPTTLHDDVINNGEIRTSAGSFTTFFGATSGSGSYTGTGTVNFEGDLKPGNSPAAISFGGNMALGVEAALRMELGGLTAGSQYDQVTVAGSLALDGTLQLLFINGFMPTAGNSFNLLDWGSLSGTFSSLSLPALAGGLTWNTSQLYTTGVVSVVSAGLPGDYNSNGVVDAGDYVLYRKYLGTTHVLPNDPTGGTIGAVQYTTWRNHFGQSAGSGGSGGLSGTALPEPASLSAAILAAILISGCVRWRR